MYKIKITPNGERFLFNVEILLSEAQLKLIYDYETGGDDYAEIADSYRVMTHENYGVVSLNPSYDIGLGAAVNDYIALGFLLANHLPGHGKATLSDLWLHPFRITVPEITGVDFHNVECEIENQYTPITRVLVESNRDSSNNSFSTF